MPTLASIGAVGLFPARLPGQRFPVTPLRVGNVTLDEVRRVGQRLQTEFRLLLDSFPVQVLSATALARWLGLKGPLCQRIVFASRQRGDPAHLVARFPGIDGLRLFLEAARRRRCDRALHTTAASAVDEFAALTCAAGGSQRRLVGAVQALLTAQMTEAGVVALDAASRQRQACFEAMAAIVGCRADVTVCLTLLSTSRTEPAKLASFLAVGKAGLVRTAGGMINGLEW